MRSLIDLIQCGLAQGRVESWNEIDAQELLHYMITTPPEQLPVIAKVKEEECRTEAKKNRDYMLDVIESFRKQGKANWQEKVDLFSGWKKKWKEVKSDSGDLDISEYISHSETPFEESVRTDHRRAEGIIFHVDTVVSSMHSYYHTLDELHKRLYPVILDRVAKNLPTKFITTTAVRYTGKALGRQKYPFDLQRSKRETTTSTGRTQKIVYDSTQAQIFVLKDWDTPISDAVWGLFSTNRSANRFGCWWCDAILGTNAFHTRVGEVQSGLPEWYPPVVFVAPRVCDYAGVWPREGIDKAVDITDDGEIQEIPIKGYIKNDYKPRRET